MNLESQSIFGNKNDRFQEAGSKKLQQRKYTNALEAYTKNKVSL
jgi:hypothetical protein